MPSIQQLRLSDNDLCRACLAGMRVLGCLVLLMGCSTDKGDGGLPAEQAVSLQADALVVSDAYFNRPVAGRSVTAAYMRLKNSSAAPLVLMEFAAEQVGRVELHNHIHSDGQMQMRKVDQLSLAPGEVVEFAPGGYHLMLFEVSQALQSADTLRVTLTADNGSHFYVDARARDLRAGSN